MAPHPKHDSLPSPPVPTPLTTTDILHNCSNGDLARVKELLTTISIAKLLPLVHDLFIKSCEARQPHMLQFLIEQFPDVETTPQLHKAAFSGGVDIYRILLAKYPALKEHSFGHTSDPISEAVRNDDIEMLDFLLAQGFEPKDSHYCYVPVLVFAQEQEVGEEIIDRLKRHGASEELSF